MTAVNPKRARTLGELGERGFIKTLLPNLARGSSRAFLVPPGDDAVVLRSPQRNVLSIDGLTEGTHFRSSWAARVERIGGFSLARGLGWKLMGSALSDLASMGDVTRRWAMVYLGAPGSVKTSFLKDLQRGVNESALAYDCALAGGDTVKAKDLSLVAAVGADLVGERPLTRAGAKPGDLICVAGIVGDARVGLDVLESRANRLSKPQARYFVRRFFEHKPMFRESEVLSTEPGVTSLIDLSDAVEDTVQIICDASRVGMAINADRIPVSPVYRKNFPVDAALLTGGEDYALFFTLNPDAMVRLRRRIPFAVIGWVRPSSSGVAYFVGGRHVPTPKSFAHFR